MRERGWTVCVVEKFNSFAKVRQDAFGFGDILAIHPQTRTIALLQTTSRSNMSSRRKKIQSLETFKDWKESGGQVILHGWKGSELKEVYL
jgi:hypothetical protein